MTRVVIPLFLSFLASGCGFVGAPSRPECVRRRRDPETRRRLRFEARPIHDQVRIGVRVAAGAVADSPRAAGRLLVRLAGY
jgi:hypothetical protein